MKEKTTEKWKRFTYPVVSRMPRLSRPWRVVRNLACIVLLAGVCYVLLGAPALTEEWAFRRAERQNLVGPTEILGAADVDWEGWSYHRLMAGKGSGYYVLCGVDWPALECWSKTGDVTLAAPPQVGRSGHAYQPLVLFTELPAVRAQIELTLTAEMAGYEEMETVTYQRDAEREAGIFIFVLADREFDYQQEGEMQALSTLINRLRGRELSRYEKPIPVTVRLWDETETLIYEKTLMIENGRKSNES